MLAKMAFVIYATTVSYILAAFFFPFVDKDIAPDMKELSKITKLTKHNHIFLVDGDGEYIGRCNPVTRTIIINKLYWETMTQKERIITLAHELYHCNCIRTHNNKIKNGCYDSYMSSYNTSGLCLKNNYDKYIEQIKLGCEYELTD